MGGRFSTQANKDIENKGEKSKEEEFEELYERKIQAFDEPASYRKFTLSEDLLQWLQEEEICNCNEDEIITIGEKWKFERAVDQRHIPEHIYYEGYGHGMKTNDSIESMNPRWGTSMDKQRGPDRIVAFLQCFKKLNEKWIKEAFHENSTFGDLVSKDLHLSDLAMQFHWGDPVEKYDIGWHVDGTNSALHMAISILGRRALHLSRKEDGHTVHWQNPGDFYIGTPFTVLHAVEYPENTFETRVFAIQARFLFPTLSDDDNRNTFSDIRVLHEMNHITSIIDKSKIIIPSLDEVMEVFSTIRS